MPAVDDVGQDGLHDLVVLAVRVVKVNVPFIALAASAGVRSLSNESWLRISTCFFSAFTWDRRNNSSNTRQVLRLCHLTLTKHVNESLADSVLAGSGASCHPDHAQASNS